MTWKLQKRITTHHDLAKNTTQTNEQVRVMFQGVTLAICQDHKTDMMDQAIAYLKVYGYMGEYRKRWLTEGFCNWSEDLRVVDLSYEVLPPEYLGKS